MKLLLDTHCLIWALTDSAALNASNRDAILAADEVWFSEASVWETGLKWRRGKIGIQPRRLVGQALRDGFRMLAIGLEPILMSCELRQAHTDPFDRLLYAQARHHGYALLTIDRKLSAFGAKVHRPPR
jgi:PIN domain nuclease of toxin-antitoxin system